MAACNMLRLTQKFSALNTHTTAWNVCQRSLSNKSLLEKLGLPEKPKKPLVPYFMYLMKVRPEVRRENPNAKPTEISKICAEMWKVLDEDEKQKLTLQYKSEVNKYKLELEKYKKSLSAEQKAEIQEAEADIKAFKDQKLIKQLKNKREKQLQKPKKPVSAFLLYALENFQRNSLFSQHMRTMSQRWNEIGDSTKKKYVDIYNKEMKQYKKDIELWEEEMIKQGNVDLVRSKTLREKLKVYS